MENFSKGERVKSRKNYFKSCVKSIILNEKGFILLNHLISLSIILILLTSIGSVVFWTIKKGKEVRADFELTRELTFVMERVTEDVNLAEKIKLDYTETGNGIFIEYRTKPNEPLTKTSYIKMDAPSGRLSRIIVKDPTAPITGDSELGQVHITSFKTKKLSEHLILIELEGISRVTNHTYLLKTAVYTQGEILE